MYTDNISFGFMRPGEENEIIRLVMRTFDEFVAPEFPEEGVLEFRKFITEESINVRIRSTSFIMVARNKRKIVAMIEVRDNKHISLFFTDKLYQGLGIARELFYRTIEICRNSTPAPHRITVNSSPNSRTFYEMLGFSPESTEQSVSGIRYTPMYYPLMKEDRN